MQSAGSVRLSSQFNDSTGVSIEQRYNATMKRSGTMMLGLLATWTGLASMQAVTSEPAVTPYAGIVDRNAFGLKPPPPPPDPETTKPPPVKITLTGITTILGNKRALMETPPPAGKPGEQPKGKQSYILTIGQREGDIEVLDIDEKSGSVKVNNSGSIVTLTFEKDGAKLPTTPAPGAAGAVPPIPGIPGPASATAPFNSRGGSSGFTLPTRTLRTTPTPGVVNPGTINPAAGMGVTVPPVPGLNAGQARAQQITDQIAGQQQNTMSPEQQMLMIEAEREANRNNPKFPPLPPTPLSQGAEGAAPGATPPGLQRPGVPPLPQ
jgi:hypothetical protein